MRPIISTLLTIVTVILFNVQAFAATAIWANHGSWLIQGDSENGFCNLAIEYESDDMIGVTAGEGLESPAMAFSGRNPRPLLKNASIVEADLTFSNGEFHRIVAEVLNPSMIIANVSYDAVGDFANTAWMEVRVRGILVGTYSLDGTRNMVEELARCIRAMNGDPA